MSLICATESVAVKQKAPVSDGRGLVLSDDLLLKYCRHRWQASDEARAGASNHQGYLRLSGAGGKYWYNQVSLSVRSLVRMNNRSSTGSTLSLVGYQSNRIR